MRPVPRGATSGAATMYCMRCGALRRVKGWRERDDVIAIELDPCRHVSVRSASLEWIVRAPEAALMKAGA
jgi:hypothetical protein